MLVCVCVCVCAGDDLESAGLLRVCACACAYVRMWVGGCAGDD